MWIRSNCINVDRYVSLNVAQGHPATRLSSDPFKLSVPHCKTESQKSFYIQWIVPMWNQLPLSVRANLSLELLRLFCLKASPTLFCNLFAQNTLACGTVRENCRGLPKTKENGIPRNAARGTIQRIRDSQLLFVKWKDKREVTMLSTIHTACGNDTGRKAKYQATGACERVDNPIPIWTHHTYNSSNTLAACFVQDSF